MSLYSIQFGLIRKISFSKASNTHNLHKQLKEISKLLIFNLHKIQLMSQVLSHHRLVYKRRTQFSFAHLVR